MGGKKQEWLFTLASCHVGRVYTHLSQLQQFYCSCSYIVPTYFALEYRPCTLHLKLDEFRLQNAVFGGTPPPCLGEKLKNDNDGDYDCTPFSLFCAQRLVLLFPNYMCLMFAIPGIATTLQCICNYIAMYLQLRCNVFAMTKHCKHRARAIS